MGTTSTFSVELKRMSEDLPVRTLRASDLHKGAQVARGAVLDVQHDGDVAVVNDRHTFS